MIAVEIIVPLSICVVLPVAIVWIVFNSITNRNNRQSDIIIEAIRNNPNVNPEKLFEIFNKKDVTPWIDLNRKLLRGSIFTLLGVTFALISFIVADPAWWIVFWVACGVFGSVGIGFLIAYLFGYKNINRLMAEQRQA